MATVLVVDDEQGLRAVLSSIIKSQGHEVLTAENGAIAIEAVKAKNPDAVFLDIRLPDMDGLQILEEIKKINSSIPVIMCSGFADVESAINTVKMGAFDYLSKPFKREEVLKAATKALESKKSPSAQAQYTAPSAFSKDAPAQAAPAVKKSVKAKKPLPMPIIAAVAGVIVLVLALFAAKSLFTTKTVFYSTPYANPTALCWDGKSIWSSDWVTQSIYKHTNDSKLSIESVFSIAGTHPTGLTYDGQYLWSCDSWAKTIYKRNAGSGLTVIVSYPSPGPEPTGLYWDGMNLWCCDSTQQKIYKLKVLSTGFEVVEKFASPCRFPVGMFSDGKYFWVADSETNGIFKLNLTNLSLVNIYNLPESESGSKVAGMAYDGKYLWACADGTQKIVKCGFGNLKKIR